MTIEAALRSWLIAQSLTFAGNVFIERAPGPAEVSPPYAVLKRSDEYPIQTHPISSTDKGTPTLRDEELDVIVASDNDADAISMRDAVHDALKGFRGYMESVHVQAALFQEFVEYYDQDTRIIYWAVRLRFLYKP